MNQDRNVKVKVAPPAEELAAPAETKIFDYKKKVIVGLGGLLLLVVGLVAGMYLSQQNQNPQSKAYSEGVLLPKPIAEWTFDEGSGNKVADSAKNHNGKWNGTGTHWTDGKFAKAGSFNGTDDYVEVKDSPTLNPTVFTVTGWVKKTAEPANYARIVAKHDWSGFKGFSIIYTQTEPRGIYFAMGNGTTEVNTTSKIINLTDNTWEHFAFTFNGAKIEIFKNGTSLGVVSFVGTYVPTSNPLLFGKSNLGDFLAGTLVDQVRIYDYPLTGAQVLKDMGVETAVPQTTTTISDDFNGASLDTGKWDTWKSPAGTTAVTANQESGVFRVTIPAGQTVYSDGVIEWKQEIQGDFEAVADLKIELAENKFTSDTYVAFHDLQEGWNNYFLLALRKETDRVRLIANTRADGNWGVESSAVLSRSSAKIKMQRTGNTLNFFYDAGSGYVLLGSRSNVFAGNGRLILTANTWGEFPAVTSVFDNFFARVNLAQQPPACPAVQGPAIKDVTGVVQTIAADSFTWLPETGGTPLTVKVGCGNVSWVREHLAGDEPDDIPMTYADLKAGHRVKIEGGFYEVKGGSVIQVTRVRDMNLRVTALEGKIKTIAADKSSFTLAGDKTVLVKDKAGCRAAKETVFSPARCGEILAVGHDVKAIGVYEETTKTMTGPAAAGAWTKITDSSYTTPTPTP